MMLIGKRYGKLVILREAPPKRYPNGTTARRVVCRCECGNLSVVYLTNLRGGRTVSCGCHGAVQHVKHGKSGTHIYATWNNMKQRCYNPNRMDYRDYGGRGIVVCDAWKNDFQTFYEDVSSLPHFGEEGYSLDRIDNNGNYEPSNVRWATYETQQENRRCGGANCNVVGCHCRSGNNGN